MKDKITFAEWVEKNDNGIGKWVHFRFLGVVCIFIRHNHRCLVISHNGIHGNVDADGHLKIRKMD